MGRRGRPPQGPQLVERLEGSQDAKARLALFIETLNGTRSVEEACAQLGIGAARFHELRSACLQQALGLLEPKPRGRPAAPEPAPEARELERLRHQVLDLSIELRAAQVREKIMLIAPHLLQPDEAPSKKKPSAAPKSPADATNSTPSSSAPSSGTST